MKIGRAVFMGLHRMVAEFVVIPNPSPNSSL